MEDITNILQHDDDINKEELKKYLSGNISDEERHAIEKKMADFPFVNDAVEGLQQFTSRQKLDEYVNHLNKDLHQYIAAKKELKEKRRDKGSFMDHCCSYHNSLVMHTCLYCCKNAAGKTNSKKFNFGTEYYQSK